MRYPCSDSDDIPVGMEERGFLSVLPREHRRWFEAGWPASHFVPRPSRLCPADRLMPSKSWRGAIPLTPALAFSPGLQKKWQHFRDCTWKCFRIESPARAHHTMQVAACMQPVGTNAPWPGPGSRGNCQGPGASVLVNSPKWLPAGIGLVSKERGALYLAQLPFTPQKSVPGVVIATPWQWSPSPPQATTPSSRPLLPE